MAEDAGPCEIFENRRRPRSLRRIEVRPEALVLVYRTRTVAVPWDEVYSLQLRQQAVVLDLADRKLVVDSRFGDWRRLAELVEQRSPTVQGLGRGQQVSSEQIANWLGIPRDGLLTVTLNAPRWVLYLGLLLMVLMFVGVAVSGGSGSIGGLVQMPIILIALLLSAERVTADADGISARVRG
ncbi:MAG: PH domain-containing protein, partial [Fimbriimonadaceae bacterium]|nr:PH domain-containing protein [Fimbriimonadaceae bacterium]